MKRVYISGVMTTLLALSGCMTEATQERFATEGTNVQSCQIRVMDAKVKIAEFKSTKARNRPAVMFKKEENALMLMIVDRMVDMNIALIESQQKSASDIDACDDILVAMVKADSLKTNGLMSIGKGAVTGTLALIGLKIFADGFGPDAYAGSSQGDTWNVSGSRVNSKSGNVSGGGTSNVSSSGEGLGLGNTFGDSQGGIQPRNIQDINDNTGGTSNSGEDVDVIDPEFLPEQ